MIITDDRPVAGGSPARPDLDDLVPVGTVPAGSVVVHQLDDPPTSVARTRRSRPTVRPEASGDAGSPTALRSAEADRLFEEFRRTGRRRHRNAIVELHLGLASHIAARMSGGRRRDPDVEQVAMLALVKAVDRFDPSFEVPFAAFASRTIEGEIKRYFRDATWALKVPRGAKDLHLVVRNGTEELSKRLGRSPTVDELAVHLQLDRSDVVTGLAAGEGRNTTTFDRPTNDDDNDPDRSRALGRVDRSFADIDDQSAVQSLLAGLPERERRIVELRFYEDLTQSEIADRMGMSQMHVSRLLRRAFDQMRVGSDQQA